MKTSKQWRGASRWGACNWVLNLALCWALLAGWQAQALIRVGTDAPGFDPGWPAGTKDYVALDSRVQWYEGPPFGGGQWTFQSRGDTDALQKAVDAFAKIQSPVREIILKAGPSTNVFHGGSAKVETFDWDMTVWVRANWDHLFKTNAPAFMQKHPDFGKVHPPLRLVVHVHDKGPDWSRIRLPDGMKVIDERAKPGRRTEELALPQRP